MSFEKFGRIFVAFFISLTLLSIGGIGLWFAIHLCPEYRFGSNDHQIDVMQLPNFLAGIFSSLIITVGTVLFIATVFKSVEDLF